MLLTAVLITSLLSAAPAPAQARPQDSLKGYPAWARALGERYLLGQTAVFVLHGNVNDLHATPEDGGRHSYDMLRGFLARSLFGSRELVLLYDPASGILGTEEPTVADLKKALGEKLQGLTTMPRLPSQALPWLHDYLRRRLAAQRSVALIITDADAVVPPGELARLPEADRQAVVTVRNWATQDAFVSADLSVVLVTERLQDIAAALTRAPHVGVYEVPLPSEQERLDLVRERLLEPGLSAWVPLPAERIAQLTEGFLLRDVSAMLYHASRAQTPLTEESIAKHRTQAAAPAGPAPAKDSPR
jgi:hypothetical protein